jgi:DNA-nicking Smr family endonuclease
MAGPKDKPEKANGDAAWQKLTATTNPLPDKNRNRHVAAAQNSPAKAANKPTTQLNSKANSKAGAPIKHAAKPPIGAVGIARNLPPQGDIMPRTRRRLARGTLPIAARLDLHGLSLAEAERALTAFVVGARAQGQVWLLVITGKGTRGEGKLRRGLPEWLERGALAGQIVEYGPAAANHGGAGAFYLRLRRSPSKGR